MSTTNERRGPSSATPERREKADSVNTSSSNANKRLDMTDPLARDRYGPCDYSLAINVREATAELVQAYDANADGQFDAEEIVSLLSQLLHEDPYTIASIMRNKFRVDRNDDGKITKDEFVAFLMEHHFGEATIQKLHGKNFYSRGKEYIMNFMEFEQTLALCFGLVGVSGQTELFADLFRRVDQNEDGFISYSEYFEFLFQYLGRGSEVCQSSTPAHSQPQRQQQDQPSPSPNVERPEVNVNNVQVDPAPQNTESMDPSLCELKALVFHQLKTVLMRYDRNFNLTMNAEEIEAVLRYFIGIDIPDMSPLVGFILSNQTELSYEDTMVRLMQLFFCDLELEGVPHDHTLILADFEFLVRKAFRIFSLGPLPELINRLFAILDDAQDGRVPMADYIQFMRFIMTTPLQGQLA